jgi:hypothetical protein
MELSMPKTGNSPQQMQQWADDGHTVFKRQARPARLSISRLYSGQPELHDEV